MPSDVFGDPYDLKYLDISCVTEAISVADWVYPRRAKKDRLTLNITPLYYLFLGVSDISSDEIWSIWWKRGQQPNRDFMMAGSISWATLLRFEGRW